MKFAEKIRQLRQQQHRTQREAAEYCGISLRTYMAYEQNGRYPRRREIYDKLAAFYGVDKNYLMTEDEEFVSEACAQYGERGRQQAEQGGVGRVVDVAPFAAFAFQQCRNEVAYQGQPNEAHEDERSAVAEVIDSLRDRVGRHYAAEQCAFALPAHRTFL